MKVHNIYSDVLLSLSYFLNFILNNQIKNFQYNIGSTSFMLDYNPNYKFPAAIINYEDSRYSNARPDTFLKAFNNINQIPVLYNNDKDILLKIQEDLFQISVEIILNCDSQYQCINFRHMIETLMPINKYLQLYQFTSYFELDTFYNNAFLFDVNNDDIENLVFKLDKITNELKHFFTVTYEPLIKLNSTNIGLQDVAASSFSLNLSFELMMQLPSKIMFNFESDKQQKSQYDDVKLLKHDNIHVPINTDKEYYEITIKDPVNHDIYIIYCPFEIENNKLIGQYTDDEVGELNVSLDIIDTIEYGNIFGIFDNQVINEAEVKLYTGEKDVKYGSVYGNNISGKLKGVTISDNKLTGLFEGEFNNSIIKSKIDNISYKFIKTRLYTDNVNINSKYKYLHHRPIVTGNIFSSIKNINFIRNEINTELTTITGLRFYNNSNKKYTQIYKLLEPVILSPDGTFVILYNVIKIVGAIDLKNGDISIKSVKSLDLSFNLELHELIFNLVFNYYPIRGIGRIQQINIDFDIVNNTISEISPIKLNNYSSNKLSIIIDSLDISKKDSNNRYTITILLPEHNINIPTEFQFYFTKNRYMTDQHKLEMILDTVKSTATKLVFSTTEEFYYKQLIEVDKIYPVFFSTPLTR